MYLKWVTLAVLWWAVGAVTDSEPLLDMDPPYCTVRYRRLCQGKGRHVACQFPAPGPGESCLNYTRIKFTKELRHFITHYINRRRQRIASGNERVRGGVHLPRPEVMMQVEWDRELALLAQRLADQCNFVHDDCRATVRFPYAGQTVGEVKWRRASGETEGQNAARAIRRVLDAWWGERRRVTVKQLTQPFRLIKGTVWGHFSQLAVWTLRAVGCGAVRHGIRYPRILLVCDFSHTNMLGQRTLSPGPLAPCPIHTARRPRSSYPLLCASVKTTGRHPQDKNSRNKLGIDDDRLDLYEIEYDENDEFYDEMEEDSSINIDAEMPKTTTKVTTTTTTTTKRDTTVAQYVTEDISDSKEIESYDEDLSKETIEVHYDRTTPKKHLQYIKKIKTTSTREREMSEKERVIPKGFISRDEDINKYNKYDKHYNFKDSESNAQYFDSPNVREKPVNIDRPLVYDKPKERKEYDDLEKPNNSRTRTWAQVADDTPIPRATPNVEKERMKSKSKSKADELAMKRNFEYNMNLIRDPTTMQPRLIQRLEQLLDVDREPQFSTAGFDNRWQLTDSYLQYRTRDWTLLPAVGAVGPKKLLEFRSRASTLGNTLYYDTARHRWRPTRDRPDRPGAKALVENTVLPTTTRPRAAKKASSMAMKMDKEDVEQLFKDTGFKPGQKKIFQAE